VGSGGTHAALQLAAADTYAADSAVRAALHLALARPRSLWNLADAAAAAIPITAPPINGWRICGQGPQRVFILLETSGKIKVST